MEDFKIFKANEFRNAEACSQRRSFRLSLDSQKTENYTKSIVIKDVIRQCLSGKLDRKDIAAVTVAVTDGLADISFPTEKTREIHIADAVKQIIRYVSSEKRRPIFARAQTVHLGKDKFSGINVRVSPDMVFTEGNTIEVVKVKCSKPSLTQQAAVNADKIECLELYSLLCYGRLFAKAGHKVQVKASFYYLRKNNDRQGDKPNFDADFFETKGGNNIVTIEEIYEKRSFPVCMMDENREVPCNDLGYDEGCPYAYMCLPYGGLTTLDVKYLPLVEKFQTGIEKHECDEKECQNCELFDCCKYTKPPVAIVKTKTQKSVADLSLTPTQEQAVEFCDGYCRIIAGAGAGKTLVFSLNIVTLLNNGVKPEEILAISFTNAACEEMLARIKLYNDDFGPGGDISKMHVSTFNGLGNEILIDKYAEIGFSEPPTVIDDVERSSIIARLLSENVVEGLDYRNFEMNNKNCKGALTMAKRAFDIIKTNSYSIADVDVIYASLGMDKRFCTKASIEGLVTLYYDYDLTLKERNMIEFADQSVLVFQILRDDPFYLEKYGIKHILVDEFQDTSLDQIELLKEFTKCPSFKSLLVVGDDDQAIYGFRNTSPEFIVNFESYIGNSVEDIILPENHRSTPEIIGFANQISGKNTKRVFKNLVATRPSGKPVVVRGFLTDDEEREFVVNGIKEHIENGTKPENICIICSQASELETMASLLTKEGIPSTLLNPELYSINSRVRAVIALSKVCSDINDSQDLLSFANGLMGGGLLDLESDAIREKMDDAKQLVKEILAISDPNAKKEKFLEVARELDVDNDEVFVAFLGTLEFKTFDNILDYCDKYYRYGAKNGFRRVHDYPGVALTTAHSSKGLEWPVVYDMISKYDSEELRRGNNSLDMTEEKRRLLFVSSTRARDELYVTGKYVAYGKEGNYTYNQFLKESYDAVGQEFSVTDIEAERLFRKQEKLAAKKAAELEAVKKPAKVATAKKTTKKPAASKPKAKLKAEESESEKTA